jgi:hypothetical protein
MASHNAPGSYYRKKRGHRNSSRKPIDYTIMSYDNLRRTKSTSPRTQNETRSLLKLWAENFHSFKGWSLSYYPKYSFSDRTQRRMRALLAHNFNNEASNLSLMWINYQSTKESHHVSRRALGLGFSDERWWEDNISKEV